MEISVLIGKRIILGVSGSIACYKSVELASKLTQAGAVVDVVLTEAARRFVTPLSFRSVTGRTVFDDMWDLKDHVRHVQLGESAELMVMAPATAHTIAKLANGLADNLLTLTALAARAPMLVAPAMDGGMYEHPATQHNLDVLMKRGAYVAGPAEGRMASGLMGTGRLLEPEELLGHIRLILGKTGRLTGRKVVVTAGPTQEPLDPVRYFSNRSTGRQGLALAQAALDAGADVTLIAGPTELPIPLVSTYVAVSSALDMKEAVLRAVQGADALLMAAAVADFRPREQASQKMKKGEIASGVLSVALERNPDILEEVCRAKQISGERIVLLGFAAETNDVVQYGWDKLQKKGLDFIAINDVSAEDAGFGVETNRVLLLGADGTEVDIPLQSKVAVAETIIRHLADGLERSGLRSEKSDMEDAGA